MRPGRNQVLENDVVGIPSLAECGSFAERAAKAAHGEIKLLEGFGDSSQAPRNVAQYLNCPDILSQYPSAMF